MAACDSFQQIFDSPLPENLTLFEALTQWNQHLIRKARKPIDLSTFSEIFGELHFHEKNNPISSSSSSSSSLSSSSSSPQSPFSLLSFLIQDQKDANANDKEKDDLTSSLSSSAAWSPSSSTSVDGSGHQNQFEGLSIKNSESLQLCTEGLGSESSDDLEDSTPNISNKEESDIDDSTGNEEEEEGEAEEEEEEAEEEEEEEEEEADEAMGKNCLSCSPDNHDHLWWKSSPSRSYSRTTAFANSGSVSGTCSFPPPISCIGRCGKPWVCFKSYRRDGRFVLKEIRIPTQEFLRACRKDGRLKLHFVQSDGEIPEEEEEEEEEDEDEDEQEEEEEEEAVKDKCGEKNE